MKLQYKCKLCGKILNNYNEFINHRLDVHNIQYNINCEICNKKLTKRGLPSHIHTIHHLTGKEYYDNYIRKPGEGICPICGKETSFIGIFKVGYLKYCSNKCSNNSKEVQKKKENTCYSNWGYKHPYQSPKIRSNIQKNLNYDGVGFDSGWEIQYYIWLKDNNRSFIYQPDPIPYIKDGETKYYHPDFYLIDTDEYIEIKASRFFKHPVSNKWNNMSIEKLYCIYGNCKILTEKTQELKDVFKYIKHKYKLNNGRKTFIKELKRGNIK